MYARFSSHILTIFAHQQTLSQTKLGKR